MSDSTPAPTAPAAPVAPETPAETAPETAPDTTPVAPDTEGAVSDDPTGDDSSRSATEKIAAKALRDLNAKAKTKVQRIADADPKPEAKAEAKPEAQAYAKPVDPDDLESVPAEKVDAMGRKSENKIPHSNVVKIVGNAVRKATEPLQAQIQETTQRLQAREAEVQEFRAAEPNLRLMFEDVDRFVDLMADTHPRWKEIKSALSGGGAPQARGVTMPSEMPQPDAPLPGGGYTYSVEGLQKLLDWNTAQVERRLQKMVEPSQQMADRMRQEEAKRAFLTQAEQTVSQMLSKARESWPGFTQHEDAIAKTWQDAQAKGQTLTLHEAYIATVVPKLSASADEVRRSVLEEIKRAPKSTALPAGAPPPKEPARKRTTAEIARENLEKLAGGA
jgi:hypothetical protein